MKDIGGAFDRLLDELHPTARQAFIDAIERIASSAQLYEIEGFLNRGDVNGLLDALNLSPDYFREVEDAIDSIFYSGARFQVSLSASLSTLPFNRRHWAAEAWAKQNGSRLIAEISEVAREGVRNYVTEALQQGRSSNAIARDLAGRLNRQTGRREGGIIGLTGQQAKYVVNARDELMRLDAGYLQRAARNRKFDGIVRRAIKSGTAIARPDLERIVQAYSDGLKIRRADVIARTETHNALNAGRYEAMRQLAEDAGMSVDAITVKWQATRDGRTRDSHRALGGKTAKYGEAFVSPTTGARMRWPGDRAYGAPASEHVNCRCTLTFDLG